MEKEDIGTMTMTEELERRIELKKQLIELTKREIRDLKNRLKELRAKQ